MVVAGRVDLDKEPGVGEETRIVCWLGWGSQLINHAGNSVVLHDGAPDLFQFAVLENLINNPGEKKHLFKEHY